MSYAALGLAVPVPLPGNPGNVSEAKPQGYSYCGSPFALQQMLADLGYDVAVDGKVGPQTIGALKQFAADNGVPWSGSGIPDNVCQVLMDTWLAKVGGGTTTTQPPVTTPPPGPAPLHLAVQPALLRRARLHYNVPGGGGGGEVQVASTGGGVIDKAKAWWAGASTGEKVAVGVGAAAVVGLLIYAVSGGGSKTVYQANRRLSKSKARAVAAVKSKVRGTQRSRAVKGEVMSLRGGKRYGHLIPPKKYWKMGARRPSDYADPKHYKYPLVFRKPGGKIDRLKTAKHIKVAKTRFSAYKHRYPMALRRVIARNINAAAKRYGVGGKIMKA